MSDRRPAPPWQEQPTPTETRPVDGVDVIARVLVDAQLGDGFWDDPQIIPDRLDVWREAHRASARPVVAALREAGWLDPEQAETLRDLIPGNAADPAVAGTWAVESDDREADRTRVVEAAREWRAASEHLMTGPAWDEEADVPEGRFTAACDALSGAVDTLERSRPRPILLSGQTMGEETGGG